MAGYSPRRIFSSSNRIEEWTWGYGSHYYRYVSRGLVGFWGSVLIGVLAMPLSAAEVYIPNQFFGLQDPFYSLNEMAQSHTGMGNPAQLNEGRFTAFRVASASDFWGYTQWSVGGSGKIAALSASALLLTEDSGDLLATSLGDDGRPQADYLFSDRHVRAQVVLGVPLVNGLSAGVRVVGVQNTLDTTRINRLWADLGFRIQWPSLGFIGVYTENGGQFRQFQGATLAHDAVARLYVQGGVHVGNVFAGMAANADVTCINAEYALSPSFALTTMGLLRIKQAPLLRGYQLGSRFRLGQVQLDYRWVNWIQTDISGTQHLLGVAYYL